MYSGDNQYEFVNRLSLTRIVSFFLYFQLKGVASSTQAVGGFAHADLKFITGPETNLWPFSLSRPLLLPQLKLLYYIL